MDVAPKGTPLRYKQDLAMIQNPDRWPAWPKLPLKKVGDSLECGYLINTSTKDNTVEPKVYLSTIFEKHEKAEVKEYQDLYAILDDGWTVD